MTQLMRARRSALQVLLWQWCYAVLVVAGCADTAADSIPVETYLAEKGGRMGEANLSGEDNGKTVDVRVGDRLIVRLQENPMTGFAWAVVSEDDKLVFLDSEYSAPSSTAVGGGGGLRTLTFFAERAGTALLQLRLWQAWEGESSVKEEFTAKVRISEP